MSSSTRISRQEYARRRRRLMEQMEPDSIAVLASAPERTRNRDVEHPYRQDSDFWYLTGFPEPDAVMVLLPGREHGEFVLFCRERDPEREVWDGFRAGPDGACEHYDADDAFPIGDIDDILPGLIEGRDRVYYDLGRDASFDQRLMHWINSIQEKVGLGAHPPGEFLALSHLLHDMRLFKSAAELRVMRRAAEISAGAHRRAMQTVHPGLYEYQLEAEYLHEFMTNGALHPAYPSIVGGGGNACVLHYIENNSKLRDGDLVLVDAGGEYNNYASDITRTFPVNGKFTRDQQAVYEIVLAAQLDAIEATVNGDDWNRPHQAAVKVLVQGLVDLGVLEGDVDEHIESGNYRRWFMHRTGHWIGLDVHDVGDYKIHDQWRVMEPGMVTTVEPGLYFHPADEQVPKRWRGMGIRIEDDVAVTKEGPDVLSRDAPKTVEEIENIMADVRRKGA